MSSNRSALGMLDATEIAATFPNPFLVLTLNLTVEYASQRSYNFFEASEAETIGKPLRELGNGQWDISFAFSLAEGRRECPLSGNENLDGYVRHWGAKLTVGRTTASGSYAD